MATLYAEEQSQVDVRNYPRRIRRRFDFEVGCLGGDRGACLSLLEGYGLASAALPQLESEELFELGLSEGEVDYDLDCSAAMARSACAGTGAAQAEGCLWEGLLSAALNETPARVAALWRQGCKAGSESACAGEVAVQQPAEATARWCQSHVHACESLWQYGEQSLGSSLPEWWRVKSSALLDGAAAGGGVAAVMARAAQRKEANVGTLAAELSKRCSQSPERCQAAAQGHLDFMERLALQIALCRTGDSRSCRFAAMRLQPVKPPSAETVALGGEVLSLGCKLGDRLTCAYLGASLFLPESGLALEPERGRTLLREACSAPGVDCYQSTVDGEHLGPEDHPSRMMLVTEPRADLLHQAACAFGERPADCEEMAEQDLDSDRMVVEPLKLMEMSCRNGSEPHCQRFVQMGNGRTTVEQLCKEGNGGACEALIWTTESERKQSDYASRACELGRCSACGYLMNWVVGGNSRKLVKILDGQCNGGCRYACGVLGEVFANGLNGIKPDEDRVQHYRQRCWDLEMSAE
jgi:hypothetical protein